MFNNCLLCVWHFWNSSWFMFGQYKNCRSVSFLRINTSTLDVKPWQKSDLLITSSRSNLACEHPTVLFVLIIWPWFQFFLTFFRLPKFIYLSIAIFSFTLISLVKKNEKEREKTLAAHTPIKQPDWFTTLAVEWPEVDLDDSSQAVC